MPDRDSDLLRYLRLHRPRRLLVGFAVLAVCQGALGGLAVRLPTGPAGDSTVQLRMLLLVGWASLAVGSVHSGMGDLEGTAGGGLRRFRRLHLLLAVTATPALVALVEAVSGSSHSIPATIRALLIWLGLAVVSGRALGWYQSWLLPLATVFPLTYLGWDPEGRVRWWNWLWQGPASAPCWMLAAVSLALGATAFRATPWRLHRLRGRLRGAR